MTSDAAILPEGTAVIISDLLIFRITRARVYDQDYSGKCTHSVLDSMWCIKKEERLYSWYFFTYTHAVSYQWLNIPSLLKMIVSTFVCI